MVELDCRGRGERAAELLIERYNALAAGERLIARLDGLGAGLRMRLLEAGMKHRVEPGARGGLELAIERGLVPAQGSMPGVHHVVSDGRASVWVSRRGARVARLDAEALRVAASAEVARGASHLALDAGRGILYVADAAADEIVVLRAADLSLLARLPAPGNPQLPLVAPGGIVCVPGPASGTLTIAHPRATGYAVQAVAVGSCPHEAALATDGEAVFVSCAGEGEIVKVRLADGRVLGRAKAGAGASHLAAAGGRLFCANSWDGTVSALTEEGERVGCAESGGWAHALAASPDGRRLFVANFLDDTISVFDAPTLARVALLAAEPYPHGLDVSPDRRHLVATGFSSEALRIYDALDLALRARLAVGRGSSHTAFACSGARAFVACSVADEIACVELGGARLEATLALEDRQ